MIVHRLRFVPCDVQAINCLAFAENGKLALSRADGSLELWNPAENWLREVVISASKDSSIESLVWCKDRLFAAGLNGLIQEWDLHKQRPLATVESFGVPVWCLAANHIEGYLAAGCEDGSVKLYGVGEDMGGLTCAGTLNIQERRVMSIAWTKSGKHVFTGGIDSTIRKYKVKSGSCQLRITLDEHQLSKDTIVWDLKCLSNDSVVGALSTGKLQIFDGRLGTLKQSFESHTADVLALAVSADERTLFASGIDQKVLRLNWITASEQFVTSESVLVHSHDVRALAISWSGQLVSGGVDSQLVLYSQELFGDKSSAIIFPPFPHNHQHYQLINDVLAVQRQKSLQFWKLQTVPKGTDIKSTPYHPNPHYLLQIKANGDDYVKCFALSSDAKLCAIGTDNAIWIYQLSLDNGQVTGLNKLDYCAYRMMFVCEAKLVLLSTDGAVDLAEGITCSNLSRVKDATRAGLPFLIGSSRDGMRVALSYIDRSGCVVDLHKNKPGILNVPRLPSIVTAVNFVRDNVVLCCASHEVFCYNLVDDKLTQWINTDTGSLLTGPIIGIFSTMIPKPLLVLYSHYDVVLINQQVFQQAKIAKTGSKRKLETPLQTSFSWSGLPVQGHVSSEYILYAKSTVAGDLCVVEKPWEDIVISLPPALLRHKYGAS